MDRYAVLGHPIKHSLSPEIHTAFARQTGQDLEYEAIELPVTSFETRVWQMFRDGFRGFNVTVPFKKDAHDFADELTERAKRARAVNTLVQLEDGRILGDTTDGAGLVFDLEEQLGWSLENSHILILGAGGAVRGILESLLESNPAQVVLANRTLAKAEDLTDDFPEIAPSSFDELEGHFDIIINGTSASLSGHLPPLPEGLITSETRCYDMMYGKGETAFNRWAREQGAKECADGLGMLVGQAAVSFEIWRGVQPEPESVLKELRGQLK
ncbi:shikimate dehydrogenase [Saccharospirillum salsuginis]|uniref:Shikimate dehydrogenase (NADP(+)) n=1 Tax=Saccharospirillum salsuginis TaxID=418750 RepID=A0A918N8D3_9GAMM|nr:shikimate dehydrogenase [Saccharospirillum salsuginis]GGX47928.1 shikimate dehydrogenase (NADP(+)) [Saccharospirillum salsuginis]